MIFGIGFKILQWRKGGKRWKEISKMLMIVELSNKVFIIWFFFLNFWVCLRFFTVKVKKKHLPNWKEGVWKTTNRVTAPSDISWYKISKDFWPTKDGNSIFWLSYSFWFWTQAGSHLLITLFGHLRWIIQKMFPLVIVFSVTHFLLT